MKKTTKILCFGLMGLLFLGIIPLSQAATNKRPIEDWIENNSPIPGFGSTEYIIWYNLYEEISECDYEGYVLEQVIGEGRLKLSVNLHVRDASVFVLDQALWEYIFIGIGEYHFMWTFEIDGEPGDQIPFWRDLYYYPDVFGFVDHKVHLIGTGEDANGASVFVNQVGITKPDFKGNSPYYSPEFGDMYPQETIRITW